MAHDAHIYGQVNSVSGLKKVFVEIRHDVHAARSRPKLTELYRRAGYLITLSNAPSWHEKFGGKSSTMRKAATHEFATTARAINRQAKQIDTEADYDEKWGKS